jgi:hypothetical protein
MIGRTVVALAFLLIHDSSEPDADWYNSLTRGEDGDQIGCCAHRDCYPIGSADYRSSATPGHDYDVRVDGKWVTVPNDSIIQHTDNPTGKPVVCIGYLDHDHETPWVRCFVLPPQT